MSKHTPGPMVAHRQFENRFQIVPAQFIAGMLDRERGSVALVIKQTQHTEQEFLANAALYAAAPDLLAACTEGESGICFPSILRAIALGTNDDTARFLRAKADEIDTAVRKATVAP